MPLKNRLNVNEVVLFISSLKPRPIWILCTVLELFREDGGVIRSVRIKQGYGSVKVHSLKQLYSLKLSLSPDVEDESGIDYPYLSLLRLLRMMLTRAPLKEMRLLFGLVLLQRTSGT